MGYYSICSYQWHIQHHANLRNIVLGLNKFGARVEFFHLGLMCRLAEVLQERGIQGLNRLVLHENVALFKPYGEGVTPQKVICSILRVQGHAPVERGKYHTLHDFVLACKDNSPELQAALMASLR